MIVRIIESWTAKMPAEKERTFTTKDNRTLTFEAHPEYIATIALVEATDGSQCRAQIILPEHLGPNDVKPENRISIEIPDFPDSPIRSRNCTRIWPAAKA